MSDVSEYPHRPCALHTRVKQCGWCTSAGCTEANRRHGNEDLVEQGWSTRDHIGTFRCGEPEIILISLLPVHQPPVGITVPLLIYLLLPATFANLRIYPQPHAAHYSRISDLTRGWPDCATRVSECSREAHRSVGGKNMRPWVVTTGSFFGTIPSICGKVPPQGGIYGRERAKVEGLAIIGGPWERARHKSGKVSPTQATNKNATYLRVISSRTRPPRPNFTVVDALFP